MIHDRFKATLFSVDSMTMLRCSAMCCCPAGEAESVLVAVRDDAATSPFDVVVKNLAHETKLKNWKAMSPEEKAISKLADVLEQVRDHSAAIWAALYSLCKFCVCMGSLWLMLSSG